MDFIRLVNPVVRWPHQPQCGRTNLHTIAYLYSRTDCNKRKEQAQNSKWGYEYLRIEQQEKGSCLMCHDVRCRLVCVRVQCSCAQFSFIAIITVVALYTVLYSPYMLPSNRGYVMIIRQYDSKCIESVTYMLNAILKGNYINKISVRYIVEFLRMKATITFYWVCVGSHMSGIYSRSTSLENKTSWFRLVCVFLYIIIKYFAYCFSCSSIISFFYSEFWVFIKSIDLVADLF